MWLGIPLKRFWERGEAGWFWQILSWGVWAVFAQLGGEMIVVFGAGPLLPRGTHFNRRAFLAIGGLAAHGSNCWTGTFSAPALASRHPHHQYGCLRRKLGPHLLPLSRGSLFQLLTRILAAAAVLFILHDIFYSYN